MAMKKRTSCRGRKTKASSLKKYQDKVEKLELKLKKAARDLEIAKANLAFMKQCQGARVG